MAVVLHLVTYGSLAVFLLAVALRFLRISRYPPHLRWELYPVPHEGKRAAHGGSVLEELDWWEQPRHRSRLTEWKYMLEEMLLLKALYEHNRKLWLRSFPFHAGLYLVAGFTGLLVIGALLELAGVAVGPEGGTFGAFLGMATLVVGAVGLTLACLGGIGLLHLRLADRELTPYTYPADILNLLFLVGTMGLALVTWRVADPHFGLLRGYLGSLLAFDLAAPTGSSLVSWTVLLASLLLAYIPLTHMSHFFIKWFTWHQIRWDDEPNVKGGRIDAMIQKALQYPVSWSADHVRGDGRKTWADVAAEEVKPRE